MTPFTPVVALSHVVTGHKAGIYRNAVKLEIEKMGKERKKDFFENLINSLLYMDEKSLPKMEECAVEKEKTGRFNKEEYLQARKELWTKRVHTLFDGEADEKDSIGI